jgi:2-amino-4-hydroxy-6-hydroxymethyldihydropteridine diphosphokinase
MEINEVALGLGSNLGDRNLFIQRAIECLATENILSEIIVSRIYETPALLPDNAQPSWNQPYLNLAIKGYTSCEPFELLTKIKEIEAKLGRRHSPRWSPREIDIDILVYGNLDMHSPPLTIPHPGLLLRDFALLPLAEIWPNWQYPVGEHQGVTLRELAAKLFPISSIRPI